MNFNFEYPAVFWGQGRSLLVIWQVFLWLTRLRVQWDLECRWTRGKEGCDKNLQGKYVQVHRWGSCVMWQVLAVEVVSKLKIHIQKTGCSSGMTGFFFSQCLRWFWGTARVESPGRRSHFGFKHLSLWVVSPLVVGSCSLSAQHHYCSQLEPDPKSWAVFVPWVPPML